MGLLDTCKDHFGTSDLYEVLDVDKTCSDDEIKRAYRKLSLKVHPDRVIEAEKEVATEKFKVLGKIHSILSDKEKRACYDETGCVDDDSNDLQEKDWNAYWRLLFKNVTTKDIDEYEIKYKGSKDELDDLIKAFNDTKGNMDLILEYVPYSNVIEEPRLRKILEDLIEKGELEAFTDFVNETPRKRAARKRKYEQEAKKAKRVATKDDVDESAILAIMQMKKKREKQSDAFFKHLEEKYSKPNKTRTKKTK